MILDLPRPVILAHRGASARAPENTMAAFELAIQEGADAIELDAQLTADDALIVFHDIRLGRLARGAGSVAETRLDEIRELEAAAHPGPSKAKHRIPLLEEVLEELGSKTMFNIHIKSYPGSRPDLVRQVCMAISHHSLQQSVLLSSFNPMDLTRAAKLLREVPRSLLAARGWLGAWARSFGFAFGDYAALHSHEADVSAQQIQRVHRLGRRLHAWTVNDPEKIRKLAGWGIDGVLTDDPAAAAIAFGRKP